MAAVTRPHANPIRTSFSLMPWRALRLMAARMLQGLADHDRDSWRNLTLEKAVDHAADHLALYLAGDRSEDHLLHFSIRAAMAVELRDVAEKARVSRDAKQRRKRNGVSASRTAKR